LSTAITLHQRMVGDIRDYINSDTAKERLGRLVPREDHREQYIFAALALCQDNPKLAECHPQSILKGVMHAAELNLELSGPLGQAYLVPRWCGKSRCQVATFQVGYRGLLTLAYRSDKVRSIQCRTVYTNEEFVAQYGTAPFMRHMPIIDGDAGDERAYYTMVIMDGGASGREISDFVVWGKERAERHRAKYSPKNDKRLGAWDTNFAEMAMKSTCIALCKRLPMMKEASMAAALDQYHEAGIFNARDMVLPGGNTRTQQLLEVLGGDDGDNATPEPDPALGTAG
jgi:recombination protein RecT